MDRRDFIKLSAGAGLSAGLGAVALGRTTRYPSHRPPPAKRKFVSAAVERLIEKVSSRIADPELAWIFQNCYPNPLDTTVDFGHRDGRLDTFVITGDIAAMWLRDAQWQLETYLPLLRHDSHLAAMMHGALNRMVHCVHLCPYANAFDKTPNGRFPYANYLTPKAPGLFQVKWEVDSLCSVVRLSHGYWRATGDTAPFDEHWRSAMDLIVHTFRVQQRLHGHGPYTYWHSIPRPGQPIPPAAYGPPGKADGMIFTAFRGSDDHVVYPLDIPENLFAVVSLKQLATMHRHIHHDHARAADCLALARQVEAATRRHGLINHPKFGRIWAYEVNGFGKSLFMDDANLPSLTALPLLGACSVHDTIYQATRKACWSAANPWFWKGEFRGVGSPHTGKQTIWPMSLAVYGLTATNEHEVAWALGELKRTTAGRGFMHESFHDNNAGKFSRAWFAMANSLFGALVVRTWQKYPHILARR